MNNLNSESDGSPNVIREGIDNVGFVKDESNADLANVKVEEKPRNDKKYTLVVPDGGWGWLVLFGAMTVNILIPGGALKSFGILFVEFIEYFHASPTEASWIPALCYFLYCGLGPISSIISARYSFRLTTIIGGLFATVGMIATYWASSIPYLYVSYGILVGIGSGLAYPPTIYIVNSYFSKYRGVANGLCTSGSAIGSIILPPILRVLLDSYGYRLTCVALGILISCTLLAAIFYDPVEKHMKRVEITKDINSTKFDELAAKYINTNKGGDSEEIEKKEEVEEGDKKTGFRHYFDISLLCDPVYLIILVSSSMNAVGYTNFIISLPNFGLTLGFSKDLSAYLLSIVSSFDLIGRLMGCALSDINVIPKSWYFVGGLAVSGVALGILPAFHSYLGISIFCALFGLGTGCYVGITPVIMADVLGIEKLTSSYGISLFVSGVLQLIGPPICLAFYEYLGSYQILFVVLGFSLFFGAVLWVLMPYAKSRNEKK